MTSTPVLARVSPEVRAHQESPESLLTAREALSEYSVLADLSRPLPPAERPLVGREHEVEMVLATLARPELSNGLLLASAGAGKTTLVQGVMARDPQRFYLEVDPAKMVTRAGSVEAMASLLKEFFDEAERFAGEQACELVLFIDEFHQLVQLSAAAVEAIKPVLAASGTRGLRILAATTYEEFHAHIAPNLPLVERLQRINLSPLDRATTVEVLRGMAQRYGLAEGFYDDHLFHLIVDYTERYAPASAQPRKSILVLDSMVGWHRLRGDALDKVLLAKVLRDTLNVEVAFDVDGTAIKASLDATVFSQDLATSVVAHRLQLCVAGLNDPSKPMASMLFTGSTGVGKATTVATPIPTWSPDGEVAWKQAGDLKVGDHCFARDGRPQKILGVFPQGEREVYRVTLGDGRTLDVSDNHLWAVYPKGRSRDEGPTIYSTATLLKKGLESTARNGRRTMKYVIPMNGAVQWPEKDLRVAPYVLGALIGDGSLRPTHDHALTFSSADEELAAKIADLLGAGCYVRNPSNFGWRFKLKPHQAKGRTSYVQIEDVVGDLPELYARGSAEKRIPAGYMTSSIEQRWELVRGLFDTDGSIGGADGDRYSVSYSTISEGLAADVRQLLFSLGVASTIGVSRRGRDGRELVEYIVRVKSRNEDKARFFSLSRKVAIAMKARGVRKEREKRYDYVGIRSIERLGRVEPMVCIYVDDDEHLYQAGQFVVTHNTELVKQLARLLFGDDTEHLIRFDMSEFSRDESLEVFRSELTRKVWDTSHAVVLFDEIEKASPLVTRLLLGVLDDGRLSDANNRQVSFLNTYIVLTTNAGSEIYQTIAAYEADDTGSGKNMAAYERLIRQSITATSGAGQFPPELLGRIDAIVPFQPLSRSTQTQIVTAKLKELVHKVRDLHGVDLRVDKRVLDYLVEDKGETDSDAGGARAAVGRLTSDVTTEVAAFINTYPQYKRLTVGVEGELVSENKTLRTSEARIKVGYYR